MQKHEQPDRRTLLRLYQVEFAIGDTVTSEREYGLSEEEAKKRLRSRYLRMHQSKVRIIWVERIGESFLFHHDGGTVRARVFGPYPVRDVGWLYRRALIARARRVAAGKPIDVASKAGRPEAEFLGWPFTAVRELLRMDHGDGFVFDEAASHLGPAYEPELRDILARLEVFGFLTQPWPDYFRIAAPGDLLRRQSVGRFSRATAQKMVSKLQAAISRFDDDPGFHHRIKVAVLFGGVLRNDVDRVGDIDLAVKLVPKDRDAPLQICEDLRELKKSVASGAIHLYWLNELEDMIRNSGEPVDYRVLAGDWRPPQPTETKTSPLSDDERRVLERLRAGEKLERNIDFYLRPSGLRCEAETVRRLAQAKALCWRAGSSEEAISTAGHVALDRGELVLPAREEE